MRKLLTPGRVTMFAVCFLTASGVTSTSQAQQKALPSIIYGGHYSERLGAQFDLQQIDLPGWGSFTAVRIVSRPNANSPLNAIGLTNGDVIVRLDGIQITSYRELENHIDWTTVRYIKSGTFDVQNGEVYISQYGGPHAIGHRPSGNVP